MNIFPFLIDADERVCTEALNALHRITGVSNRYCTCRRVLQHVDLATASFHSVLFATL